MKKNAPHTEPPKYVNIVPRYGKPHVTTPSGKDCWCHPTEDSKQYLLIHRPLRKVRQTRQ